MPFLITALPAMSSAILSDASTSSPAL